MSSLSNMKDHLSLTQKITVDLHDHESPMPIDIPETLELPALERRANATFVLLARNKDIEGVVQSVQSVEDRFNHKYNYPWVLLNEEPFTPEFKRYRFHSGIYTPTMTESFPDGSESSRMHQFSSVLFLENTGSNRTGSTRTWLKRTEGRW